MKVYFTSTDFSNCQQIQPGEKNTFKCYVWLTPQILIKIYLLIFLAWRQGKMHGLEFGWLQTDLKIKVWQRAAKIHILPQFDRWTMTLPYTTQDILSCIFFKLWKKLVQCISLVQIHDLFVYVKEILVCNVNTPAYHSHLIQEWSLMLVEHTF